MMISQSIIELFNQVRSPSSRPNPLARPWRGEYMGIATMSVTPEAMPLCRQLLRRRGWRLYKTTDLYYVFRWTLPLGTPVMGVTLTRLDTGGISFRYECFKGHGPQI